MQHLGKQQHPEKFRQRTQQQPAQRRQQETRQQHPAHGKPRQDPAHQQEDQHLRYHADRPEQANQTAAVTQVFEVQRQEGVIRSVAHLHQAHADIERQYARVAQLPQEALPRNARPLQWLGVGHPETGKDDAAHDQHQRHRVDVQAQPFEQAAEHHHGDDETDGTP
ncbi:hypothetical protein D3C76_1145980 [compost metagenome]